MADDLQTELEAAAGGPAMARDDEGQMQSHNLRDLVEADKHVRRTAQTSRTGLPIKLFKLRPPGAV